MKILLFRTCPTVMKIDTYNSQEIGLAKAFIGMGHQCDIIYYNGHRENKVQIIPVFGGEIKIYWRRGVSILRNGIFGGIRPILEQYDIIQVCEYDQFTSWLTYAFSKKNNVYIYHGPYDSEILIKHKLRSRIVDALMIHNWVTKGKTVFTKSVLAEESIRKRGFEHVITVGVGIDKERLAKYGEDSIENTFVQRLIREKGNTKYLLYVGVLEDRRNIDFLIKTFSRVCHARNDVRLIIVGSGNQSYVNQCFHLMEIENVYDKVLYCSSLKQSELAEVYINSDLFLFPTKYEIFGMVLLEALYFGLPVISSYNGGSVTLMNGPKVGIIEEEFDSLRWSEDICMLLNDAKERREMSENAVALINAEFMWDSIAKKMLVEYESKYTEEL